MSSSRCFASMVVSVACSACSVEVVLDGKGCPCLSDHRCVDDVCVPAAEATGGCLMGVGAFRASWATPHSIRWEWDPIGRYDEFPAGREEDLLEYRLHTGESVIDVEQRSATWREWTATDNPELGVFTLRRTGIEEIVAHTITDGLDPGEGYYAQLEVVDSAGCEFVSPNIAGKQTTDATEHIDVLVDQEEIGWGELHPVPIEQAAACYAGSGCWYGDFECDTDDPCHKNFHAGGLGRPLTDAGGFGLSTGNFATAYLEFWLKSVVEQQPWWGVVILGFDDPDVAWGIEPLVFRKGGDYQRVEVPLSALVRRDTAETAYPVPLTPEETAGVLDTFSVGLLGAPGEVVWVDEVKVGW